MADFGLARLDTLLGERVLLLDLGEKPREDLDDGGRSQRGRHHIRVWRERAERMIGPVRQAHRQGCCSSSSPGLAL
jgi:hypothetical protein